MSEEQLQTTRLSTVAEQGKKLERVLVRACRSCNEADNSTPRNPAVHSLLRSDLNVPLPLHISLSAPLTLKTEQKDAVAAAVEASVTRSGAGPFVVKPTRLCWVSNSEGSRSFLVLQLSRPENDDLNRLLSACNASVTHFGLKPLYCTYSSSFPSSSLSTSAPYPGAVSGDRSDAFHVSIAWTLGDLNNMWSSAGLGHFDTVKLKIGNVVRDMRL
ncbi:hypothetical protein DV735_g5706, partial [Chaetothyriales sp. CBS 134920]